MDTQSTCKLLLNSLYVMLYISMHGYMSEWQITTPYRNHMHDVIEYVSKHIHVHSEQKLVHPYQRSGAFDLWTAVKVSAQYLVNHDPDIAPTHRHIRQELTSMLEAMQKGSTYDQLHILERLDALHGVFDYHEQMLQGKLEQAQRPFNSEIVANTIACKLYITSYLKQELHNVIGNLKTMLSTNDGTFLGRAQHTVINFLKQCIGLWTPESLIRAYIHQYTNQGAFCQVPIPDAGRLYTIDQNSFNQALQTLDGYLQQGELQKVERIVQSYEHDKQAYTLLQSYVHSSPHAAHHMHMRHESQQLLGDRKCISSHDSYHQSREQALQKVAQGNLAVSHQQYNLSSCATQVLLKAGYDPMQFKECVGNAIQQDTHAKLVQSLNTLAQKPTHTHAVRQVKEGVLACAQAGAQLNHIGNVRDAIAMTDICHIAVNHLWNCIDTTVAVGKGIGQGLLTGCISWCRAQQQAEPTLSAALYSSAIQDGIKDQVAYATADIVSDLLTLCRDIGEVGIEVGHGISDSVCNMKDLIPTLADTVKIAAQGLGYAAMETCKLLDAADRADEQGFVQQVGHMSQDIAALQHGIALYITELGKHINAHTPRDGRINKTHVKTAVRVGARMVTDRLILRDGMRGISTICKGISSHLQHVAKDLSSLKDISASEFRTCALVAQLERGPVAPQIGACDKVVTLVRQAVPQLAEKVESAHKVVGAVKTTLATQRACSCC